MPLRRSPNRHEVTDPSWSRYPQTVLEFEGSVTVDLRHGVSPDALLGLGLGAQFGVITAYNPHGKVAAEAANIAQDRQLAEWIADEGYVARRATGRSQDHTHAEPGCAVAASRSILVQATTRFGQTAMFWFDGQNFWLVPVDGEPMRLPR